MASLLRLSRALVFSIFVLCTESAQPDAVRRPPSITNGPFGQTVFAQVKTESITIPCEASGFPQPAEETSYEWFKNGASLNYYNNHVRTPGTGTLKITSPTEHDAGYYWCTAKNQWGKARSDVQQLIMASLANFKSGDIKSVTVNEGDPWTLHCENQPKAVPNATISWAVASSKEDTNPLSITFDGRIGQDDKGSLHFAHVEQGDMRNNYIYRCSVKNVYMDHTVGGGYTRLTVTPKDVRTIAPQVRYKSETAVTGVKGRNITLYCFFSGKPQPGIQWSKVNGILPSGRIATAGGETQLIIKSLELEDKGTYSCSGSNGAGSASGSTVVDIKIVPEFIDYPRDINITEGEDVLINCRTRADPEASVVWFINGAPFAETNRYRRSKDGLSLNIKSVCRDCNDVDMKSDLMTVSCNASNMYGYAYASGYINVLQKTLMTIKPESLTMKYPNKINMTCGGTSDPSTPVIVQWYNEKNELLHNDDKIVITQDNEGNGKLHINISEDQDKGASRAGAYTCIVTNGYSKDSMTVQVDKSPDSGKIEVLPAMIPWWIIVAIIAALLLFFIIILLCIVCVKRNKGDVYKVDKSEVMNGNDPKQELINSGYKSYVRPELDAPSMRKWGSKMSINSECSLGAYEADTGKFNEDGSFIGAYNGDMRGRGANV